MQRSMEMFACSGLSEPGPFCSPSTFLCLPASVLSDGPLLLTARCRAFGTLRR